MLDQIAQKVISIVASVKRIPVETISIESTLEQLGIDSLDSINILFELEDVFKIDIPDEQARSIRDIPHMVEGVRKLAVNGSGSTSSRAS